VDTDSDSEMEAANSAMEVSKNSEREYGEN
jgi:hypothetical protein